MAEAKLKSLIWGYLNLKKKFENSVLNSSSKLSDVIRHEIKGSNLRSDIRRGSHRQLRRAFGILDHVVSLLEENNVMVVGYVHVKCDNKGPRSGVYPDAVARLAHEFEAQLAAASTSGVMILDARTKSKNVPSVHTITTRKFKAGGDCLAHLVESPVFGHSDSHVGVQIADLLVSALIFPMACSAYCGDVVNNVHPHKNYDQIRARYGARIRALEHRYQDACGERRGGIVVFDTRNRRKSVELYGA